MLNRILIYGTVAGLMVGAMSFATLAGWDGTPRPWGMALGYTVMLVALSAVFVAIKRRRDDDLGGVIRFWPAFGMGVGISVVAGLFYVLAWEAVLMVNDADFMGIYTAQQVSEKKAAGASAAEIAAYSAEMAEFRKSYANPLFRMPITFTEIFPVGLLVSLVSAGLLRNPRFMPVQRTKAAL